MTQMKIYSVLIHDEANNVHPIYECHSWEKAQEIIDSTIAVAGGKSFTFEVVGRVDSNENAH
jgi:hypothetical protein